MKRLKITLGLFLSLSLVACGGGSTSQPGNPPPSNPPPADIKVTAPESFGLEQGSDGSFVLQVDGVPNIQVDDLNISFPDTRKLSVINILSNGLGKFTVNLSAGEQLPIGTVNGILTIKTSTFTKIFPLPIRIKSKSTGSNYLSFGVNGIAFLKLPDGADVNDISEIALDSQGRILVVGYARLNRGTETAITVTRFLSTGILDNTFGNGGSTLINLNDEKDFRKQIRITPNEHILVFGINDAKFEIIRLLENGNIDSSYGLQGILYLDRAPLTFLSPNFEAIQDSRGKITVSLQSSSNGILSEISLRRLNAEGTVDSSFSPSSFNYASGEFSFSKIQVLSSGEIILATNEDINSRNILLRKIGANGELDKAFGSSGQISLDLGSNRDVLSTLLVNPQDQIILLGRTQNKSPVLVKLTKDGSRVALFGNNGQIVFTEDRDVGLFSALQGDSKITLYRLFTNGKSAAIKVDAAGNLDRFFFNQPLSIDNLYTGVNGIAWDKKFNRYIHYGGFGITENGKYSRRGVLYTSAP